ncbi:hypothetical protein KI387_041494, partial [Taxus chinensis]
RAERAEQKRRERDSGFPRPLSRGHWWRIDGVVCGGVFFAPNYRSTSLSRWRPAAGAGPMTPLEAR